MNRMRALSAVIITYFPDRSRLGALLAAVCPEVAHVFVVDNTDGSGRLQASELPAPNVRLMGAGENFGVGRALNVGVAAAQAEGSEAVVLFDQDSLPEGGFFAGLWQVWVERRQGRPRLAAVGPVIVDLGSDTAAPFVEFRLPFNRHHRDTRLDPVPADFLITSGCLVDLASFKEVGGFREDLFIDNVDLEWCFRARSCGYGLLGTFSARLRHQIGDVVPGVGVRRYVAVRQHSPLRQYYMFRNRFCLYRMAHVPLAWKVHDCLRAAGKLFYLLVLDEQRGLNARCVGLGIRDAFRGRLGRLPLSSCEGLKGGSGGGTACS